MVPQGDAMPSRTSLCFAALALVFPCTVPAQVGSALGRTVPFPVADAPFGPGEVLNYRVEWGIFGDVGSAKLAVAAIDTVHGRSTYHITFELKGKVKLFFVTAATVDDLYQTWLDVEHLSSRRFDRRQREPRTNRHQIFEFFPDRMRWEEFNAQQSGDLASAEPLDDISFLYFVRTLPLEIGDNYTFNRYWKNEGNPVVVKVLRRDTVMVDGDPIPTIVVQPLIKTKGIFNEGGEAEVHFSDDERRLIVYLDAKMAIARMKMKLEGFSPGSPLRSAEASGGRFAYWTEWLVQSLGR
jgi:hypothetical protein